MVYSWPLQEFYESAHHERHESDSDYEFFQYIDRQPDSVPSSMSVPISDKHVAMVAVACNVVAKRFSQTGPDEPIEATEVAECRLPKWVLAQGVWLYLNLNEWDAWVDELLERAPQLESTFSSFITAGQATPPVRCKVSRKTCAAECYGYPMQTGAAEAAKEWHRRGFIV